jgi:hypothetical protein
MNTFSKKTSSKNSRFSNLDEQRSTQDNIKQIHSQSKNTKSIFAREKTLEVNEETFPDLVQKKDTSLQKKQ